VTADEHALSDGAGVAVKAGSMAGLLDEVQRRGEIGAAPDAAGVPASQVTPLRDALVDRWPRRS
jgi:hypothetical protein